MQRKNKKIMWIVITLLIIIIVTSIILMGLFIPVRGVRNDDEYWSEYDDFSLEKIKSLNFDGSEFKILQLTDLHYHLPHLTSKTDRIIKTLVEQEKPDMIVITGDSVFGPTNIFYSKHIVRLMDDFEIPWAIVYGNHDEEGKADKFWMGEQYANSKYGLYSNGAFNIGGTGNYTVNLTQNGKPFYSFIMMDSNRQTIINGKKEYGSFLPSQVSWYEWLINGLKAKGYEDSMMFFHIPFPEFTAAYDEWEKSGFSDEIGFGQKQENVCSAPYNPGMFKKITQQKHTTHVFVGHDHINNFSINYQGVRLTYGLKSSGQFYFEKDMVGGTLITIDSSKTVSIEHKFLAW